jgi:hypothetical protein
VQPPHASAWTEAVFHVLAHVDVGRVPASCHDPRWIRWAAERMGPAAQRRLAEDAAVLATTLASHEHLARAQALAWAFPSADAARAVAARDLDALEKNDALSLALSAGPGAEVLRAAAELELDAIEALGAPPDDRAAIARALAAVAAAAPYLARCDVRLARPLPVRGRAFGRAIVVGFPRIAGAEADFVAWQAAHEATVLEIGPGAFEDVERRAIATLRSRARRAGLGDAHARWLAGIDLSALGPIPDVDDVADEST